jgi:hypothetical protein
MPFSSKLWELLQIAGVLFLLLSKGKNIIQAKHFRQKGMQVTKVFAKAWRREYQWAVNC